MRALDRPGPDCWWLVKCTDLNEGQSNVCMWNRHSLLSYSARRIHCWVRIRSGAQQRQRNACLLEGLQLGCMTAVKRLSRW